MSGGRGRYRALAGGLLATGPLVTISANLMDNTRAEGREGGTTVWGRLKEEMGQVHSFDHPFVQVGCMFLAQASCLLPHLLGGERSPRQGRSPLSRRPGRCAKLCEQAEVWLALPALCDVLGTSCLYAGLCLTYASVCEMLRCSASLVFTTLLSSLFLKRRTESHQWLGVLLSVAGIAAVFLASVRHDSCETKWAYSVGLGNGLVLMAQVLIAAQICVEERMVPATSTPALKLVGAEGLWGLLALCCMMALLQCVRVNGLPLEDVGDAWAQIQGSGVLIAAFLVYIPGVFLWNILGVQIAQSMDASHGMVIDSLRTLLVWAFSVTFGWEKFRPLQVFGFLAMLLGAGVHNAQIGLPCPRYPRLQERSDPLARSMQEMDCGSFHRSFSRA